jgi:ketosteroid isomerase-like protein
MLGLLVALSMGIAHAADDEATVRRLDDEERLAILNEDLVALERLMAKDVIVHNPQNRVLVGRDAVFDRIKQGLIRYRTFERTPELVRVEGDIAFAMGGETLVPEHDATQPGETVHRRYTNVWRRSGDSWQLIARQATIVGKD